MPDRKPMIAGNWKMFKTGQEAVETATSLAEITASPSEAEIMIAPSFVQLHPVAQAMEGSRVALARKICSGKGRHLHRHRISLDAAFRRIRIRPRRPIRAETIFRRNRRDREQYFNQLRLRSGDFIGIDGQERSVYQVSKYKLLFFEHRGGTPDV